VISRNADEMQKHVGSFDFIFDAVAADHDISAYINLLRRDGNITLVGAPSKPLAVSAFVLIMGRRSLSGSPIGGIPPKPGKCSISAGSTTLPLMSKPSDPEGQRSLRENAQSRMQGGLSRIADHESAHVGL
jgi:NADPH:quinone reductase-like Zn-dependent oxidoreductase